MRVVGAMKINTYEFIQNKKKCAKCTLHKYNPTMFLAKIYIYCHSLTVQKEKVYVLSNETRANVFPLQHAKLFNNLYI